MIAVYDGSKVVLMLNGVEITGFMDNTPIKFSANNEAVSALEDLHGAVSFAVSNSKLGTGEFTLSQTSPSLHYCLDLANRKTLVPVWVHSNNDVSEKAGGPQAIITKVPGVEFGKAITGRTFKVLISGYEETA